MIEFFNNIHAQLLDPARIPVAILALVLAAIAGVVTGPMHGNANPLIQNVFEKIFGAFGARLDRRERTPGDLAARGLFVTAIALLVAGFAGEKLQQLVLSWPLHGVTEVMLLALGVTGGAVWYALLKLFFALKDKKKVEKGAYYIIARSARVDLSNVDDFTITRAGMALAARSFDKGVVAPVLWYLIAGLPGACIYLALAALVFRFGREGFTRGFGRVPLALEGLMGIVPHILAGILMALAGLFTPTGGMTRAFRGLLAGQGRAPYHEGGAPLTAMAWSLDVSLGGPMTDLDGYNLKKQWVGPENATARLESGHLRRALYISLMAYLLFMASLMGAYVWGAGLF